MMYPYFAPIAWGAIACLASQASAQYVTVTTGHCSSQGYQHIDDINECESAAQELRPLPAGRNYRVVVYEPTYPYLTLGCLWSYSGYSVSFKVEDTGSHSWIDCGRNADGCICKAGIAAETTTSITTTPVTSTATATIQLTTEFLAPTSFTTTTSGTSPSCLYKFLVDTAVKGWAAEGEKLNRASYESDADYLDACRTECNADSKCAGFVDDLTEGRPRMCKPKTSTRWAYSKPEKNFYVKGLGC